MYFGLEVFVAFVLGAFCTAVSLGIVVAYLFKRLLDLTSNEFERQLKLQERDAKTQFKDLKDTYIEIVRSLASVGDKPKNGRVIHGNFQKKSKDPDESGPHGAA